jgi:hypothetical protein
MKAPKIQRIGKKIPRKNIHPCPFLSVINPSVNATTRYRKAPPIPIPHHMMGLLRVLLLTEPTYNRTRRAALAWRARSLGQKALATVSRIAGEQSLDVGERPRSPPTRPVFYSPSWAERESLGVTSQNLDSRERRSSAYGVTPDARSGGARLETCLLR